MVQRCLSISTNTMRTGAPIWEAASARPILYLRLAARSVSRRSSAMSRVAADFGSWTRSQRARSTGSPSWRMRRTAMGRQFGGGGPSCKALNLASWRPATMLSRMSLAGLVLAAGRSERMGTPKALLDFRGQPDVRRAARSSGHLGPRAFRGARVEQRWDAAWRPGGAARSGGPDPQRRGGRSRCDRRPQHARRLRALGAGGESGHLLSHW